jgi:hypothetical protein
MRHREVDAACLHSLGPLGDTTGEPNRGLRPAGDLDIPPGEQAGYPEPERFSDRLLPGEAGGVVLRRILPGVAVRLLLRSETAVAEPAVPLERGPDAADLDHVDAHPGQS